MNDIFEALANLNTFLEQLQQKLHTGSAQPPPSFHQLTRAISRAVDELENEKVSGTSRFGKSFEDGNQNTVIALQKNAIQLQRSLLQGLCGAVLHRDWSSVDLVGALEAVEKCRTQVLAVLHEFVQHLIKTQPSIEILPLRPTSTGSSGLSDSSRRRDSNLSGSAPSHHSRLASVSSQEPVNFGHMRKASKTWTRPEYIVSETPEDSGQDSVAEHSDEKRRSRFSVFAAFHRHGHGRHHSHSKPHSNVQTNEQPEQEERPSSPTRRPSSQSNTSHDATHRQSIQLPPPHVVESHTWDDSTSDVWSRGRLSTDRRDTVVAPDSNEPAQYSLPSPVLTHRTNSSSYMSVNPTPKAVPMPTPENDFLGFCKGAWKLQTGDRKGAFSKRGEAEAWSRHASSVSNTLQYLTCSHGRCSFRSHFSHPNTDYIWNRIFVDADRGLRYRWTFLAKSHVYQRGVPLRHEYGFQCLFCVFLGVQHPHRATGLPDYLDHVAKEHRLSAAAGPLSDVILHRAGCIADREASDSEIFDINFLPLSPDELRVRAASIAPAPGEVGANSMDEHWLDGKDSVMNGVSGNAQAEPWNTGLSDFHYQDKFDRAEI